MAKHPNIQRRAQEEIDRVVGSDRLPDFNDRPSLPYIDAIYRELLRHTPPLALGLPHVATEDDIYEGYFIPRGTFYDDPYDSDLIIAFLGSIVIGNIWAMTHDETMYPDPFTFKPERFLDSNGRLNDDSRIMAYGFGRRCVPQINILLKPHILCMVLRQDLCWKVCCKCHRKSSSPTAGFCFNVNDFSLKPCSCGLSSHPSSAASILTKRKTRTATTSKLTRPMWTWES